jgi:hypothetical protein
MASFTLVFVPSAEHEKEHERDDEPLFRGRKNKNAKESLHSAA